MLSNPLRAVRPEELFSSKASLRNEYISLAKYWHPDNARTGDAVVMAHIQSLYDQAQTLTVWRAPTLVSVKTKRNTTITMRYDFDHDFELGRFYYSDKTLLYIVEQKYSQVFRKLPMYIFPNPKMGEVIASWLPGRATNEFEAHDSSVVGWAYVKAPHKYLLRDCLPKINKDPAHVAWIMNRLYDLLCYFQFAKITHNNLSVDSVFISPEKHSITIHGWWYWAAPGSKLSFLPKLAHRVTPPDILKAKTADHRIDLAMIKALGRELLGDWTGMTLPKTPTVQFLRSPSTGSALEDFKLWENAVAAQFGPKRVFHKLENPDA